MKNIVLRQKFEKPNLASPKKVSQDDTINNHSLTREEKEKILSLFDMVDINVSNQKSSPLKGGILLRAKSPYRMEKIIEQNKLLYDIDIIYKNNLIREEKLRAIKTKVMNLLKTPKNQWSAEEYNLLSILTDPKVMALIKKI